MASKKTQHSETPFVLGVDLDGVCADYTTAFREIAAQELGVDQSELPLKRSWDFSEWGLSTCLLYTSDAADE